MIGSGQNSSADGRLRRVVQLEAAVLHRSVRDELESEKVESRDNRVGNATRVSAKSADQRRVLVVAVSNSQVVVLKHSYKDIE